MAWCVLYISKLTVVTVMMLMQQHITRVTTGLMMSFIMITWTLPRPPGSCSSQH